MGILLTESAQTAGVGSMLPVILMYVLIFGVFFYFVLYRPQKKEQKKMSAMLSTLEIGDCVLTSSGFYGIIIDITDDTVIVEFGNNKNCRIPMQKSAISQVETAEAESKYGQGETAARSWERRRLFVITGEMRPVSRHTKSPSGRMRTSRKGIWLLTQLRFGAYFLV